MTSLIPLDPVADARRISQQSASRIQQKQEAIKSFDERTKRRLREHRRTKRRQTAEDASESSLADAELTPFEAALLQVTFPLQACQCLLSLSPRPPDRAYR